EAEAKAKAEEEARIKAEAEAKAKAEEEARIKAEAEDQAQAEEDNDENIISAGGRTFNFIPFDSATYVPKRAPRLPDSKNKRSKSKNSTATEKYYYTGAHSEEPKVGASVRSAALPPPVFKGNTTNIDTSYGDIASATESTESPYVPPVSVQKAARNQYVNVSGKTLESDTAPASTEPIAAYLDTNTSQTNKQRIPMLKSSIPGLPQQPSLTLRAGILHSSNPSRYPDDSQHTGIAQTDKKNRRKH
ncbi:MAG: hypothetical protein ACI376_04800, partial [Candidatus Bruticola sp.]